MCVTPVHVQAELSERVSEEWSVRRAPVQQDPHYHGLLWIVAYMRAKTIEDPMKVLIGTPNNIRCRHEWFDWEKDVCD